MGDTDPTLKPEALAGHAQRDHDDIPVYRYRPRLMAAEVVLRLEDDALAWKTGFQAQRIAYSDIAHVRLRYMPANVFTHRYRIDLRARDGRRVFFTNVSWRGLAELEALDAPYAGFVGALHQKLAALRSGPTFVRGDAGWRYWLMVLVAAALVLMLALVLARVASEQQHALAAVIATLGGYFGWQAGHMLRRNKPGTYAPDALPSVLLPRIAS